MNMNILQSGVPAWHTAEEMQLFSNAAHIAEGLILAAVALSALAQQFGHLGRGRWRFLWPGLLLGAGVFLLAYLLIPWHGLSMSLPQWRFIFGDPQQRQHFIIAVALTVCGAAEVANVRRFRRWLAPVFPLAVLLIGAAFLSHTQHGAASSMQRAMLVHRLLGITLIVSAALALASRLKPEMAALRYAWPVALLGSAALLFTYREPKGAYHGEHVTADAAETVVVAPLVGQSLADNLLAYMNRLEHVESVPDTTLRKRLPLNINMLRDIIAEYDREMRVLDVPADTSWRVIVDSLRLDLDKMPTLPAADLPTFLPGHQRRVRNLIRAHERMLQQNRARAP